MNLDTPYIIENNREQETAINSKDNQEKYRKI